MKKYDLEPRLIKFSVAVINMANTLPRDRFGNYFGDQLIRAGSSPALNYGEAQAAESRRDFIHKL